MDPKKYRSVLANAFAQNGFLKIVLTISAVVNVLLAIVLFSAVDSTRVVVVPPEIEKGFWVDKDKVSETYLEQMALFIAQLELNVTPASQGYQAKQLLKYVHPSLAGKMESAFLAEGEQLKKDNASTWFRPTLVRVDAKSKQVAITGDYAVTVAEKQVVNVSKTYVAEFEMSGNRLFLTRFGEANEAELFKKPGEKGKAASVVPATAEKGG